MNILLIFFALPIATIIISIALQKLLRSPALVAAVVFAIFLIVTFILNDLNFLIATIVYTIISFITAIVVCLIHRYFRDNQNCNDNVETTNNSTVNTIETNPYIDNNYWANTNCSNQNRSNPKIEIVPNSNNNRYRYNYYKRCR